MRTDLPFPSWADQLHRAVDEAFTLTVAAQPEAELEAAPVAEDLADPAHHAGIGQRAGRERTLTF